MRFLTNHAHVLLCIRRDEEVRLRDIATLVGITEWATEKIVSDLREDRSVYRCVSRSCESTALAWPQSC